MSKIVIAALMALTLSLVNHELRAADATAASFWTIQNKDAPAARVAQLHAALAACEKGLADYFPRKPEKLTVFAYGSQEYFAAGLIEELGFRKEEAASFAHGGAPRPMRGKLLVPPGMGARDVCFELVYPYLESHADRTQLRQAEWFVQGTASFLADNILGESGLAGLDDRLRQIGRDGLIPLEKMGSESQWRELYKAKETRSLAYLQAESMLRYFFTKYSTKQFQSILDKTGAQSFAEAFAQAAGIPAKRFHEDWLRSLGPGSTLPAQAKAAALKLSFIIDRDYDADHIVGMFRHQDPAGIETRARSMGIDPEVAKKIRGADPAAARKAAQGIVADIFARHHGEIEAAARDIRLRWADLLQPFSDAVVRSMQRPWRHPEYVCVVSSVHPGLSDWHGNKVAIGYNRPDFWLRILAHELVLSNAYQAMFDAHGGGRHELDDWQIWAFSEITAVLVLDDPALNRFWPNTPRAGHYFGPSYPQLADFEKQLKLIYDDRASFDDFMAKAVPVLQRFHHG